MLKPDHELLTVKEVAAWLRLSLAEVYRLIRSSELAHYRVGPGSGAIRVKREDVDLFLNSRKKGPKGRRPVKQVAVALKHVTRHTT